MISSRAKEDYKLNSIDNFWTRDIIKRGTLKWLLYKLPKKCLKISFDKIWLKNTSLPKKIDGYDLALAIGGDNYCYSLGIAFWGEDQIMSEFTRKTMLVGCSIEPNELKGVLSNHLKIFDVITARETITYNALCENGLGDKTILAPDTAFLLGTNQPSKSEHYFDKQVVGLNLSPLSLEYTEHKNIFLESIDNMVEEIIKSTNYDILLIPHVVVSGGNDIEVLDTIYEKFKNTNRINIIRDTELTCEELKWYISKCKLFIGARTHSTIAAYSSNVPTLAIGYSIKSKGIAKDLFGEYENYVIPVDSIRNSNTLVNSFRWLNENCEDIKKRLEKIMPEYKINAHKSIDEALQLL